MHGVLAAQLTHRVNVMVRKQWRLCTFVSARCASGTSCNPWTVENTVGLPGTWYGIHTNILPCTVVPVPYGYLVYQVPGTGTAWTVMDRIRADSSCVEVTHSAACPSLWLSSRCAQLSPKHNSTARHVVATTTREATGRATVHRSTHAPATGPTSSAPLHEARPAWRSRRPRAERRCAACTEDASTPAAQRRRAESVEIDDAPRAPCTSSHGRGLCTRACSSPGINHLQDLG